MPDMPDKESLRAVASLVMMHALVSRGDKNSNENLATQAGTLADAWMADQAKAQAQAKAAAAAAPAPDAPKDGDTK